MNEFPPPPIGPTDLYQTTLVPAGGLSMVNIGSVLVVLWIGRVASLSLLSIPLISYAILYRVSIHHGNLSSALLNRPKLKADVTADIAALSEFSTPTALSPLIRPQVNNHKDPNNNAIEIRTSSAKMWLAPPNSRTAENNIKPVSMLICLFSFNNIATFFKK
jgi:hypothetical protein